MTPKTSDFNETTARLFARAQNWFLINRHKYPSKYRIANYQLLFVHIFLHTCVVKT